MRRIPFKLLAELRTVQPTDLPATVTEALHQEKYLGFAGHPESPRSSVYVVRTLSGLGYVTEYTGELVGDNVCVPRVYVFPHGSPELPIERAIQIIHDSHPCEFASFPRVLVATYRLEPLDPYNPDHYKFIVQSQPI